MLAKRFVFVFWLFVFPFYVFAQDADDAAKNKQRRQAVLIEQILGDVTNLKLGENRALVYAKVGSLICKTDEKHARSLFQTAVSELINAQTQAESDKKSNVYQNELLTGQTTRPQVLNTIARCDAEMALEYLYKTRLPRISKALLTSSDKNSKISDSNYSYLAVNETNLEQSFIRLAADQNPERAIKLLKESLKKGLSGETLNLLKKLHEKDADSADEIASDIVGKLFQSGFNSESQLDYQNTNVALAFLNEFIREKTPTEKAVKFDDAQMRNLADKLISFYLQPSNRNGYYMGYTILPIAEKLAPGRVEKIKQLSNNNARRGFGMIMDPELNKLLNNSDTTAEKLLAEAAKYPMESRRQIYQTAASKLAQQGDLNRATEILNDNFSDDALEQAIQNLNWQYSYSLISAGKFEEAERIIEGFPESSRLSILVNLANAIYQKSPTDNKSYAVSVLGKARALIADKPEDTNEMSVLMQIISAYSTIEPAEAFRLFESLIPQINELSEAAAVINGFQRNGNVKQGEFLLTSGNPWGFYGADFSILGRLAGKDFERATSLIDSFGRRETRIALKLQLAEGF